MNIFTGIWHFFEDIFKHNSPFVQTVLAATKPYIDKALAIVEQVDDEVKAVATVAEGSKLAVAIDKVTPFLAAFEKDVPKVEAFVATLTGKDAATELHNIAVFALTALFPASGLTLKLANFVIELAYNTFETKKAATPVAVPAKS